MIESSLLEALARLGPVREFVRAQSGSSEKVEVSLLGALRGVRTIDAMRALAYCGPSLLQAKRAIEDVIEGGTTTLSLSHVPDVAALTAQLAAAGFHLTVITPPATVDVAAIRAQTAMTQEQFARRYGFDVATLRKWEAGRSKPETGVRSYLALIARDPQGVLRLAGRG